jgi:DivIVA domain-containing protein
MDGTPHLLTDVQFSERRRGYDPEEVDNFLERVSAAVAQLQDKLREVTARAEASDAGLADAQRAQAAAEAELSRLGGETASPTAAPVDPEVEAEKASRVLLMAQKTADATIDDANVTAQQSIAEARARAASLVGDAEAEAEKLRAEAKREADELVEQQRAVVVRDVKELEDVRARVQADVDKLNAHFDEQRARIRRGVEALGLVLDDPDQLRIEDSPELEGASLGDVISDEADQADDSGPDSEPTESAAAGETSGLASGDREEVVDLDQGIDVSGVDLTSAPQPSRPGGLFANESSSEGESEPVSNAPQMSSTTPTEFPEVPVPDVMKSSAPDIDLSSEELFAAADRDERSGPPTQQFAPFGDNDDPLGPADDEADKAMRAFFEADFDSETEQQKSRFGFRR